MLEQLRQDGAVTVKKLAELLGVSEMTVRRDVNELSRQGLVTRVHGGVTLRSRLDRTAGEREPRDGALARYTLGMVVPSLDYYWPHVVDGAQLAAAQAGTRLLLRGSTYDAADNRKQIQMLLDRPDVHGILVAPETVGERGRELMRWLDTLPLPVVLAERRPIPDIPSMHLESVATEHARGAEKAVLHLRELGHERVGLLLAETRPTAPAVRRGWQETLGLLGVDPGETVYEDAGPFEGPGGERFMDGVLERCRATRTTALLIFADAHALRFVQHASDRGVRVPDDLAVVAYDDDIAHLGLPALSAVRPPKSWVGKVGIELLVSRLDEGTSRPMHHVRLVPELIVRESSAPQVTVAKGRT
ncbi:LacI family DNA-binding transcriptional regulator [[Actinomadura] parvosata]|uniref:LacI family DNA-binding transcriptional regulator n=1 Tax=[Actinomadura] parvosata TaxID=1955412 RepID=UPI00406C103F